MEISQIKKYQKKSIPQLIKLATEKFNAFIRERDQDQPCISCGEFKQLMAGHYYSGGHYPETRFNEDNVNGQCERCNYYLSGNLIEYRKGLEKKIGIERLEKLDLIIAMAKQTGYKWDRYFLIETILKYYQKYKL